MSKRLGFICAVYSKKLPWESDLSADQISSEFSPKKLLKNRIFSVGWAFSFAWKGVCVQRCLNKPEIGTIKVSKFVANPIGSWYKKSTWSFEHSACRHEKQSAKATGFRKASFLFSTAEVRLKKWRCSHA